MLPAPRSYRLPALAIGVLLALGAAMLVAFSSTADARPAAASTSSLGFTTPTPTLTGTPTPTATPIPGYPQMTDIVCNPTLTADSVSVDLLDEVTFTFDAGCACSGDFDCGYYAWSAHLTSGGFALTEQFGNPPPTSFTATAVNPGVLDITVTYFGEKQVGSLYFTGTLSASTQVTVEPVPIISPTPTPTPYVSPVVVCSPSLTASNDMPAIGDDVSFSFDANCTCPANPGVGCYFAMYSRESVSGDGFDFSDVVLGTAARGTAVVGIAAAAGPTNVSITWYGETWNGSHFHWTYQTATVTVDVQSAAPLTCMADAGTVTWNDVGKSKYWIYRSTPNSPAFSWLGRTTGATTFADPNPVVGAEYQVRYAGAAPFACDVISQPSNPRPPFACRVDGDDITWTDHGRTKYWIYRSTDDGRTYSWLGRTTGATAFTDRNPVDGALYQVHYAGIPRVDCTAGAQA